MARVDASKLPASVRNALSALEGGHKLCRQMAKHSGASAFEYFLYPGGREIRPETAEALIRLDLVAASGDGLFDGASQTYVPVGARRWQNG